LGYPQGSMTVHLPGHPDHAGLKVYSFLVDSGATCSLCTPATHSLLLRQGSTPPMLVTGVGGSCLQPLGAGFLDICMPASGAWVQPSGDPVQPSAGRCMRFVGTSSSDSEIPLVPRMGGLLRADSAPAGGSGAAVVSSSVPRTEAVAVPTTELPLPPVPRAGGRGRWLCLLLCLARRRSRCPQRCSLFLLRLVWGVNQVTSKMIQYTQ